MGFWDQKNKSPETLPSGGVKEMLKGIFDSVFDQKEKKLNDKVDILTQDTETSKRTAEILDSTSFKKKFEDFYGVDEGKEKFEIFNRKISYVVKNYIDSEIPQYDETFRVELATGFQFTLMKKMTELGVEDSTKFFSQFSQVDGNNLKGIVRGLFAWLKKSSGFVDLGERFQNYLRFLQEYKDDLGSLSLQAWAVPHFLLDDKQSVIWTSWTNFEGKSFDEIKGKLPVSLFQSLDDKQENSYLQGIANNASSTLSKKLLDSLSNKKGWALVFASQFLSYKPKLRDMFLKPIIFASKFFDNKFLWKYLLWWKSVVDFLSEKHNGKTMNLVLSVLWFHGGREGLKRVIDTKNTPKQKEDKPHTNPNENVDNNYSWDKKEITNRDFLQYTMNQIEKTESSHQYDAINPYDVTGVSLWKFQWHDGLAHKLMQSMKKKDPDKFKNIMGNDFVKLMDKKPNETWNIRRGPKKNSSWWETSPANWEKNHPKFLSSFKKLMKEKEFQTAMDGFAQDTIRSYLKNAKNLWITDPAIAVYFARLSNRWPAKAKEFWEKGDKTLAGLHQIVQKERANDAGDPLNHIYNPLFADLQKHTFDDVNLNSVA